MKAKESIALEEKPEIKVEKSEPTFGDRNSNLVIYIKKFFSENILAKIGSILVFFSVVFLMSLVWSEFNAV